MSRKLRDGRCASGIGAFVVINRDGWVLTAAHILRDISDAAVSAMAHQQYDEQLAVIAADATLDERERRQRTRALTRPNNHAPCRSSAWWGWDGAKPVAHSMLPDVDLAVVKLEGIAPGGIAEYPKFKDPAKPTRTGTSLCRLGYPFHDIVPSYDEGRGAFMLPPGSVPPPFFASEGIVSRFRSVGDVQGNTRVIPRLFVETSSPGLRGQSGGPIFDRTGAVWGIQSQTAHFPLGFSPSVPGGKNGEVEHQFLNVGVGVHPATLVAVLEDLKIPFELAPN